MQAAEIETSVQEIATDARRASLSLATASSEEKNRVLLELAGLLENSTGALIEENRKDLEAGAATGLSEALIDRLTLTEKRVSGMAEGLRQVAALEDPVGEIIETLRRPNGLVIEKIRVPIGVIGIIYESRPNVTIDCAALCLKSGNACILRGGKEAFHTNTALASLISKVLAQSSLPPKAVRLVPTTDRYALHCLLKMDEAIQCIIPRGGESLIRFVVENSHIPVIKHYKGVCNVYVDREADLDMAEAIVVNAKCQRPGVCNAAENLLIHTDIAANFLPRIARELIARGVELRLDPGAAEIAGITGDFPFTEATPEDWSEEYLAPILAVRIVDSLEEAIEFINTSGSGHSDAIVTAGPETARRFFQSVDSAAVYWNASTRFTDGFEFGMGAEIGISTDKLHARGPMGLKELCTYKYIITGQGTIRE